jgi:hypothetical protein
MTITDANLYVNTRILVICDLPKRPANRASTCRPVLGAWAACGWRTARVVSRTNADNSLVGARLTPAGWIAQASIDPASEATGRVIRG